jgi:hypothetical protein
MDEQEQKRQAVIAELNETLERYVKKLTPVQREVFNLMRYEGCFIVSPFLKSPKLVRPDLTVVKRVSKRTVCALNEFMGCRDAWLGDMTHYQGRIYYSAKLEDAVFAIRIYEASVKADEEQKTGKKQAENGSQGGTNGNSDNNDPD